ncbi:MAG TPA: hypothetical protein VF526_16535 [Solirubrobacteraceae bacterium]|jgi:hypothetical protein
MNDLRDAVTGAVEGSGCWIVVVHGRSKVGKSRSLDSVDRSYATD